MTNLWYILYLTIPSAEKTVVTSQALLISVIKQRKVSQVSQCQHEIPRNEQRREEWVTQEAREAQLRMNDLTVLVEQLGQDLEMAKWDFLALISSVEILAWKGKFARREAFEEDPMLVYILTSKTTTTQSHSRLYLIDG